MIMEAQPTQYAMIEAQPTQYAMTTKRRSIEAGGMTTKRRSIEAGGMALLDGTVAETADVPECVAKKISAR